MLGLRQAILGVSVLVAVTLPAMAIGLPKPTGLPAQQAVPDPRPYDTAANADAQVDAAFARARTSGKLVLLDLGANWCPDCRMLNSDLHMPQVAAWKDSHFETVMVNVDRFNVNMDIPKRYGVTLHQVPTVLVLTPNGRLLDPDGIEALGDARGMAPQAVVDLISSWAQRAR